MGPLAPSVVAAVGREAPSAVAADAGGGHAQAVGPEASAAVAAVGPEAASAEQPTPSGGGDLPWEERVGDGPVVPRGGAARSAPEGCVPSRGPAPRRRPALS